MVDASVSGQLDLDEAAEVQDQGDVVRCPQDAPPSIRKLGEVVRRPFHSMSLNPLSLAHAFTWSPSAVPFQR